MKSIKIVANGMYLPKHKVLNEELSINLKLENDYIYKRTGIEQRFFAENETIEELAIKSVINMQENSKVNINDIDMIIVATTSTEKLMPGISYLIQKEFKIKKCMCLDILAGCGGYINAFDIARNYIAIGKVKKALVIGVDVLSKYTDKNDIGTYIILSDGAGATILESCNEKKGYFSYIESNGEKGQILECNLNKKIYMDGKEVYKYAVTDTVKNINELLKNSNENLDNIKYIIPHQSNIKIMKAIASRLKIDMSKMYANIDKTGNTFCASIPIVLSEMFEKKLLNDGDKIILLGYGGGLNTGTILLEV